MGDNSAVVRSRIAPVRAAQRIHSAIRPKVEILPVPADAVTEFNVPVTTRDGTVLRVNVFRPVGDTPVPVIMSAHPYGKDAFPLNGRRGRGINRQYRIMPQPRPVRFSGWTSWEAPDPAVWVARGYAVVNADSRGGGTSDGRGTLLSDQEAEDYYDLVEWAGTQTWSTGKVALDGVSYLTLSQYKVAALRPPHLAAICPWEGFSDFYRDFGRPGGIREDGFSILWGAVTSRAARVTENPRHELVTRAERDDWYVAATPRLEDIEVPMLVCGSFSDHNLHTRGSFEAFRRAGSARKWVYTHRDGKWAHYYGTEATETRAAFFDHVLKGEANGWDARPPVRLAVHERGADPVAVSHESQWPPADLTWTPLFLDPATATLVSEAPAASSATTSTWGRGLRFTWTAPHDLDLIGPMALRVTLSSHDLDDVHLFAGIRKFHDGREDVFEGSFGFNGAMVTHGWQRAAFRELDAALSTEIEPVHTFRTPQPLTPGESVDVDIALRPQATRLRAGDVLRLDLRGTWHYPRNPVFGQLPSGYEKSRRGRFTVSSGASRLLLGWRAISEG